MSAELFKSLGKDLDKKCMYVARTIDDFGNDDVLESPLRSRVFQTLTNIISI